MNNHPIEVLMETAMNSIKEMVDVNTIHCRFHQNLYWMIIHKLFSFITFSIIFPLFFENMQKVE